MGRSVGAYDLGLRQSGGGDAFTARARIARNARAQNMTVRAQRVRSSRIVVPLPQPMSSIRPSVARRGPGSPRQAGERAVLPIWLLGPARVAALLQYSASVV